MSTDNPTNYATGIPTREELATRCVNSVRNRVLGMTARDMPFVRGAIMWDMCPLQSYVNELKESVDEGHAQEMLRGVRSRILTLTPCNVESHRASIAWDLYQLKDYIEEKITVKIDGEKK